MNHLKQFFGLKRESGISLVETLFAVLIIGFALVAFMLTQSQSHRTASATQRHSVAVHLAQQQLEALKRMDGSGVDRNESKWVEILEKPPITNDVNGIRYTTTTALIPDPELPGPIQNYAKIIPIRVTVSWPEPGGAAGPVIKSISIDNFYHP